MRQLKRNLDVSSFPDSFTGEKHIEKMEGLLEDRQDFLKDPDAKIEFRSSVWKVAKLQLISETKHKCAYCESYFTSVSYGDVEHFRPKSKYWWLAYSYVNYAASCQLCNQKYKKAVFNTKNNRTKGPNVKTTTRESTLRRMANFVSPDPLSADESDFETFANKHSRERPLMIDPYIDDPVDYFKYEINDLTKEVTIESLSDRASIKRVAEGAIALVGLNRKTLLTRRYEALVLYRIMREFNEDANSNRFKEISEAGLSFLRSDSSEFTGMYRYFDDRELVVLPL